jgi:hypothetical protein
MLCGKNLFGRDTKIEFYVKFVRVLDLFDRREITQTDLLAIGAAIF